MVLGRGKFILAFDPLTLSHSAPFEIRVRRCAKQISRLRTDYKKKSEPRDLQRSLIASRISERREAVASPPQQSQAPTPVFRNRSVFTIIWPPDSGRKEGRFLKAGNSSQAGILGQNKQYVGGDVPSA